MARNIVFKSRPMLRVEAAIGEPLEEYLRRRYTDEGLTQRELAEALGVDTSTIARWMGALDIEARFPGPRRQVA